MVKLLSNHLKSTERALVRKYAHFVLRRMVRPSILRDSLITIKVSSPEELRTSQDRRDMKDFLRAQRILARDGPLIGMGAQIAVPVAKGVGDLGDHGAKRACIIMGEPK